MVCWGTSWLKSETQLCRRSFLKAAGVIVAGSLTSPKQVLGAFSSSEASRSLFMHNVHTGEFLKTLYWEKGSYIPEAFKDIHVFFRDRFTHQVRAIHPDLINLLHSIYKKTGTTKPLELFSGYRCASTNASLRRKSSKVASQSFHMKGMAADFSIPGIPLKTLKAIANAQGAGGLGYYPNTGFIHIDVRTGTQKRW